MSAPPLSFTIDAATACSLIETAKLSAVDPKAWFADILARVSDDCLASAPSGQI